MGTPLNVNALSTTTVDTSGDYNVSLGIGSSIVVGRDAGTPTGDPVSVTFDTVSATALASVTVQHGTLEVDGILGLSALTSYTIGDGGHLVLSDTLGASLLSPINFDGTGGILTLDSDLALSVGSGITGFGTGDVISFSDVPAATSVSYSNGQITLYNGSAEVAQVAVSGDFDATGLGFQSDGQGGISVGLGLGNGGGRADDVFTTGLHDEYIVARTPLGQLYLQDEIAGRDQTQTISDGHFILFADGVGRFDASGTAEEVAHLYKAAFDRTPDAGGLDYWTGQIESGAMSENGVAAAFTGSAEFQAAYAGQDNTGFVSQLYENVLGRAGDAAGIAYWAQQLSNGATQADVLQGFSHSFENVQNSLSFTGDEQFGEAYRLYEAALNRAPETSGLSYWYNRLEGGDALSNVAQGFIASAEFNSNYGNLGNSDFVDQLYQNVLGRAADQAGHDFWTSALDNGETRADVLIGFSDSLENRVQTADATHDNWIFLGTA
ncbi:DUF4214 domain-containing protein [Roseomonas elaeocarpi]|uniref:DUF4214 domain-containing protein n=1 Tax=Roseomonas elaeocarpi TaxID=907779 RepID=A0ABV6JTU0_9PROT